MKDFVEYCKTNEGNLVGGKLDDDDLISFDDMQKYWDEYIKLFIPFVVEKSEQLVCFNCDGYGYTVDENGRRKEHCTKCE